MTGRDAEQAVLLGALDDADGGTPAFAAVTGEPGIGKSRLCAEVAALARERGARVVIGRCTQDDGAPPLWPWRAVLRGLGHDLDVSADDDEGASFRTWEGVVDTILRECARDLLVVVLDDLHWADPATLRVLRLLLESADAGRLLVVLTWRTHPEPVGALGDLAEALSRHHSTRLTLSGLAVEDVASLLESVTHHEPTPRQATLLAERTDGNPFFLVEFARLATATGDLDGLLADRVPPGAVHEVVRRRLERLPEQASTLVQWASVVGRGFDLDLLTAASGTGPDLALDLMEPAVEAGLIRETGVGEWRFGHALVRDTAYAKLGATRAARAHARLAQLLSGVPGRETEVARHWLAAGSRHARSAWTACVEAARSARAVHAHEQAAVLLADAVTAHGQDPLGTGPERYALLMALAGAHLAGGDSASLLDAIQPAMRVADEIGDIELLAVAASTVAVDALWQSGGHGEAHESIIAALRRALAELPVTDSAVRCRALLALASETYYSTPFEERAALVDSGVDMAQRLGDIQLMIDARLVGFVALWQPATVLRRVTLAREALAIAAEHGPDRARAVAATLLAVGLGEAGEAAEMWRVAEQAREHSERLRLSYPLLVLDSLEIAWLAMSERVVEMHARQEHLRELIGRHPVHEAGDALDSAQLSMDVWTGSLDARLDDALAALRREPLPIAAVIGQLLVRAGRLDEARDLLPAAHEAMSAQMFLTLLNWAAAAEMACALGDSSLGADAYAHLAPLAGFAVCGGAGFAMGPVDAFLALAACSVGAGDLAHEHAARAEDLMRQWAIPAVERWWRAEREHYSI